MKFKQGDTVIYKSRIKQFVVGNPIAYAKTHKNFINYVVLNDIPICTLNEYVNKMAIDVSGLKHCRMLLTEKRCHLKSETQSNIER